MARERMLRQTKIDIAAREFLTRKGIDLNEVAEVNVKIGPSHFPLITVSMFYEDPPEVMHPASSQYMTQVGEHGSELTVPETDKEV